MFISLRNYNASNNPSKNDKVEDYVSIDSLDAAEHFAKFAKAKNDFLRLDLFTVFFTAQCDQVKFGRPPDVDMMT